MKLILMMWLLRVAMMPEVVTGSTAQVGGDQGRDLVNRACTSCHDLRPIQTSAKDADGWIDTLNVMVENGAEVSTIEQLILVDYLLRNHGPVPDGQGRDLMLERCTVCHDLARVRAHEGTRVLWEEALQAMRDEGAVLDDAEFATMLDYLSEHFGP